MSGQFFYHRIKDSLVSLMAELVGSYVVVVVHGSQQGPQLPSIVHDTASLVDLKQVKINKLWFKMS